MSCWPTEVRGVALASLALVGGCLSASSYTGLDVGGSALVASGTGAVADGVDRVAITVAVRRADGRPVPGVGVVLQADACTIDQPAGPTDANGVVHGILRSGVAGNHVVQATLMRADLVAVLPAPLTVAFAVPAAHDTTAGAPLTLGVVAHDAAGVVDGSFTGALVLGSSDPQASLPPAALPAPGPGGPPQRLATVVLRTAGPQTLWATEGPGGPRRWQLAVQVAAAPAVALTFSGLPARIVAGSAPPVQLRAVDAFGNTAVAYRGTVGIASSAAAEAPAYVRFGAAAAGVLGGAAVAPLTHAGPQALHAQDVAVPAIAGESATVQVDAGAAAALRLTLPAALISGAPATAAVAVVDAFGNVAAGFAGAVTLSSSDAAAAPVLLPLPAAAAGAGSAALTLQTAGAQQVTASAAALESAQATVDVAAGPVQALALAGLPAQLQAGGQAAVTVRAVDAAGNTAVDYLGTVAVRASDPQASADSNALIYVVSSGGAQNVAITWRTAGPQQLTVVDVGSGLTAAQGLQVQPAPAAALRLTAPAQAVAGAAFDVAVAAVDAFGNAAAAPAAQVLLGSSDPAAQLPAAAALDATGARAWPGAATLRQAGAQQLTAVDTGGGLAAAPPQPVAVAPAAGARLAFLVGPTDANACASLPPLQVQAQDIFGNPVPSWPAPVALALAGGALLGASQQALAGSTATFAGLHVAQPASNLVLTARAAGLAAAASAPFAVRPTSPTLGLQAPQVAGELVTLPLQVQAACPVSLTLGVDPSGGSNFVSATVEPGATTAARNLVAAAAPLGATLTWRPARDLPAPFAGTVSLQVIATTADGGRTQAVTQVAVDSRAQLAGHAAAAASSNALGCLAVGDLVRDGHPDVVGCQGTTAALRLWRGDAAGALAAAPTAIALPARATAVRLADVNRDGQLDVLAALPTALWLAPGDGAGHFGTAVQSALPAAVDDLALGDVDANGTLDAVAALHNNTLVWRLGAGSGSFGGGGSQAVPTSTRHALALGDLDRNGRDDAVVAAADANALAVLLGAGGGFAAATTVALAAAPLAVAIADLDQDGNGDVAAVGQGGLVWVLRGDGQGNLAAPQQVGGGAALAGLAVVDLDGNGWPDLVGAAAAGLTMVAGSQVGGVAAPWQPPRLLGGTAPAAAPLTLAVADVDGDGRPDVLTGDAAGQLRVALNQTPRPPLTPLATRLTPLGANTVAAAAADLDEDGRDDAALLQADGTLLLLHSNGDGTFRSAGQVAAGSDLRHIVAADLDGDGHVDLALTDAASGSVVVGRGDGQGHVALALTAPIAAEVGPLAVADLNGDGHPDLLVGALSDGSASTLLGDGQGNFGLPTRLAFGARAVAVAAGDLDHDGLADPVVLDAGTGHLLFAPSDGRGGLRAGLQTVGSGCRDQVRLADLNGDGALDAVSVGPADRISVFVGDGQGNLVAAGSAPASIQSHDVAIGDYTGDGLPDLWPAIPFSQNGDGDILANNGQAVFAPVARAAPRPGSNFVVPADLDGDGRLDGLGSFMGSGLQAIIGRRGVGLPSVSLRLQYYNDRTGGVAVADLDRDGRLDVAANGWYGIGLFCYGDGQAGCRTATNLNLAQGGNQIVAADLDGDGWLDLAADDTSQLAVLFQSPGSGYGSPQVLAGSSPGAVGVADLNRDGRPDLLAGDYPGPVTAYLNQGGRSFAAASTLLTGTGGLFATGDINHDGAVDLVACGSAGDVLIKPLDPNGVPRGGTGASTTLTLPGARGVLLADLDGDANLDVLAAGSAGLAVARGHGDGSFAPWVAAPPPAVGASPSDVLTVGDLDHDGHLDALQVAHGAAFYSFLSWYRGVGDGTLLPPVHLYVSTTDYWNVQVAPAVADFDRDGRPDVISSTSGNLVVDRLDLAPGG